MCERFTKDLLRKLQGRPSPGRQFLILLRPAGGYSAPAMFGQGENCNCDSFPKESHKIFNVVRYNTKDFLTIHKASPPNGKVSKWQTPPMPKFPNGTMVGGAIPLRGGGWHMAFSASEGTPPSNSRISETNRTFGGPLSGNSRISETRGQVPPPPPA